MSQRQMLVLEPSRRPQRQHVPVVSIVAPTIALSVAQAAFGVASLVYQDVVERPGQLNCAEGCLLR